MEYPESGTVDSWFGIWESENPGLENLKPVEDWTLMARDLRISNEVSFRSVCESWASPSVFLRLDLPGIHVKHILGEGKL